MCVVRHTLGLLAGIVVLLAPSAAHASARSEAAAFAGAATRTSNEIRGLAPQTRVDIAASDFARCGPAVPRFAALNPSPETLARFQVLGNTLVRQLAFDRTLAPLQRFVGALDAIRTTDPALRSARAAWRRYVADLEIVVATALPPDGCTQFAAWVDAGATAPLFPQVDLGPAGKVFASGAGSRGNAVIQRGAARLSRLGQTSRRAKRFTVEGMLAEHLRISQSLVASYAPPGSG